MAEKNVTVKVAFELELHVFEKRSKWLRSKCFLCKDICKQLDFERETVGPVSQPLHSQRNWDVKEPTHWLLRVGDVLPGVVRSISHGVSDCYIGATVCVAWQCPCQELANLSTV